VQGTAIVWALTSNTHFLERIRSAQASANTTRRLIEENYQRPKPSRPKGDYHLTDNVLYHRHAAVVPNVSLKLEIMKTFHDSELAGHPGAKKTTELITRHFWRPCIKPYVENYVASCETCKRCKYSRHKPHGFLLLPLPVPTELWLSISMDLIIKLPKSKSFNSILVVVDRCSKMFALRCHILFHATKNPPPKTSPTCS